MSKAFPAVIRVRKGHFYIRVENPESPFCGVEQEALHEDAWNENIQEGLPVEVRWEGKTLRIVRRLADLKRFVRTQDQSAVES